jgi:putative salt-induced outer membrane protein
MHNRAWLFGCLTLLPLAAWADDAPPPPQGVWLGKGQLGFLASQGNTEATSANAAIDMRMVSDPWEHKLHLDALYGKSADVVAAERWTAGWQSNYDFTPDVFGFGGLRYQHDEFSGFQYQASETVGAGYKLINSNDTKLSLQAGVGYRELRPEDLIKGMNGAVVQRIPLATDNGVVFTFGLDYTQAFTSTTSLSDKLLVEAGSGDTLITDTVALTVKMSTQLALSVGYSLQDNTTPPDGLKKIDSLETVNLVFSF